jgi:putative ABC transport system permease protein
MLSELWSDLRYRARALFRRADMERELDAELHDHLQREAEKYEREGLPPEEARQRARRAFGRVSQAREATRAARGTVFLESLFQDLRHALRGWRARPAFAALVVLILALGIGATSGIFSLVDGILLRPLPYPHAERLVQLRQAYPEIGLDSWALSNENVAMYRDCVPELASFAGWAWRGVTLAREGRPRRLSVARVTGDFFRVLGVRPLIGRTFGRTADTPGSPADVVVLTTIDLNGRPTQVLGVMPPGFEFPRPETQAWMPLGLDPARRFGWYITGVGRLAPGATISAARRSSRQAMWRWTATMPGLFHGVDPRTTGMTTLVKPLRDAVVGDTRRPLEVLQAAVLLILLIAVVNIALLFSNRAAGRGREMALRGALGATGPRLARQLLTESLSLAVVGGCLGVALAFLLVHVARHSPAVSLPRIGDVGVSWRVLAFTLLTSVGAGVGFGLAPALGLLRGRATASLAGAERGGASAATRRFNGALIMTQLALAAVLLIAAGLVLRSFQNLTNTRLGFESRNVTTIALPLPAAKYADNTLVVRTTSDMVARVRAVPGVRDAAISWRLPFGGNYDTDGYVIEGRPPPAKTGVETQTVQIGVGPGYFRTLGIPLRYGRDFDARDRAGSVPVTIVDETLASRYWHGADALGQRMQLTGDSSTWFTIIGVVGGVRDESPAEPPRPHSYFPFAQAPVSSPMLTVRTEGEAAPALAAVERAIRAVEPGVPLDDVRPLTDWVGRSLDTQRITELLLAAFALLAALLASVGIYGVMSLYVTDRYREFGVRLAIGAQPRGLVRMVLGQGMGLAVAGVAVGIAGALVATRWLGTLLYGVSASDPLVYAVLAAALLAVAAFSVYLPARRAARSDPLEALRAE